MSIDVVKLLAKDGAEFLEDAYRLLLHREADPGGKSHYLSMLAKGYRKDLVLHEIDSSAERRRFSSKGLERITSYLQEAKSASKGDPGRQAIILLTHHRVEYFRKVLRSLLAQTLQIGQLLERYTLFIFQDGLSADAGVDAREGHREISRMLEALPTAVRIIKQSGNLGIAQSYDLAERLVFDTEQYPSAIFFEDDLVLAPGYIRTMELAAERFRGDERIGMYSACRADTTANLQTQRAEAGAWLQMGHSWGFALTRQFWQLRQPFVDEYLKLIQGAPYERRPHRQVLEWLGKAGFHPAASSQDYVKECATMALGRCRVTTGANFGLPIGRRGVHFTPEEFTALGFDRSIVYDQPLLEVEELHQDRFEAMLRYDRTLPNGKPYGLRDPLSFSYQRWSDDLLSNRFAVSALQSGSPIETTTAAAFGQPVFSAAPHMPQAQIEHLESLLRSSRSYLEFGAGGSTLLALTCHVPIIYSVESDGTYIDAIARHFEKIESKSRLILHHAFIGPTKNWGYPAEQSYASQWPSYCISVWSKIKNEQDSPDLILIDGRFRVGCFLTSLINAKNGATILFDDYALRPHYHIVEAFIKPESMTGEMATFLVKGRPDPAKVLAVLQTAYFDPR